MLVEQVPDRLHAGQDDRARVTELFQIEAHCLPLGLHLLDLGLELALLGGDLTDLGDVVDNLHDTLLDELLDALS